MDQFQENCQKEGQTERWTDRRTNPNLWNPSGLDWGPSLRENHKELIKNNKLILKVKNIMFLLKKLTRLH